MGTPLTLALAGGENPLSPAVSEAWISPADLAFAQANDSVDLQSVCDVASQILFTLSGRKFGVRTETVRPYAGQRACGWTLWPMTEWQWRIQPNESRPDWLILKSPVIDIVSVMLDGVQLDSSAYRLYDNRKLVRMPDPGTGLRQYWPLYQLLDSDDTQTGTFSVTYQWGQAVPEGGKMAAQVFASQLVKYINNDSDCALPDRTISVSRQGVTQTILDPQQFIKEARTGLYLVDTWLASVNPYGNRKRPSITSPDSPELVRATPGDGSPIGFGGQAWGV